MSCYSARMMCGDSKDKSGDPVQEERVGFERITMRTMEECVLIPQILGERWHGRVKLGLSGRKGHQKRDFRSRDEGQFEGEMLRKRLNPGRKFRRDNFNHLRVEHQEVGSGQETNAGLKGCG